MIPMLILPVRRLALLLVGFYMGEMNGVQIITTNSINLVFAIYFTHYRPHPNRLMNQMEIFNEGSIVISGIHYITFTEFVADADTREYVGYSLIVVMVVGLVVNAIAYTRDAAVFLYLVPVRQWNWFVSTIGCESLMSYVKPDDYVERMQKKWFSEKWKRLVAGADHE